MRGAVALGLLGSFAASASCYSPAPAAGAPCSASQTCPSSQVCDTTQSPPTCVTSIGGHPDAALGVDGTIVDGHGDAAPHDGDMIDAFVVDAPLAGLCFGTGLVKDKCFSSKPTGDLELTGSATINTATTGSGGCTKIVTQMGAAPSLCMIGADTITIDSGATITASGTNVLVLVAATTLTVHGAIDVSSHAGSNARAPGAAAACGSGANGTSAMIEGGGGGGAGGSFGLVGAAGGDGTATGFGSASGGSATAAIVPMVAIGGCPGGKGGDAAFGASGASGGFGGGVIYLIAGVTIAIDGDLRANGGGGAAGTRGLEGASGGGGGGAGGLIGLDAPMMMITGTLSANGGGGGGGGGQLGSASAGKDSTSPTVAASGGDGGNGGGDGGSGYAQGTPPVVGQDSGNTDGGGGGGGGGGAVRVFQVAPGTLGGTISPPPS